MHPNGQTKPQDGASIRPSANRGESPMEATPLCAVAIRSRPGAAALSRALLPMLPWAGGVRPPAWGDHRIASFLAFPVGVIAALGVVLSAGQNAEPAEISLAPQVIHAFSASATAPNGLIQARDGNLYGTTGSTLFRMTPGGT